MALLNHPSHVAAEIVPDPEHRQIRLIQPVNNNTVWDMGFEQFEGITDRLERARFRQAMKMGKIKNIPEITEALIERWRPERNCFDFPTGEKTITLEDVAYITGLPVDGDVVTSPNCLLFIYKWCELTLSGTPPCVKPHSYGHTHGIPWLRSTMVNYLNENPSPDRYDKCNRALMLLLIGGVLMPMKSSNMLHCMYLPLLLDFDRTKMYSWGVTALAWLYRALYKSTCRETSQFDGCIYILFGWFWPRWPTLAPLAKSQLSVDYNSR